MILKGSTVNDVNHAYVMVNHLLKDENEKIIIHDMLGMGNDKQALRDAMVEMQLYTKLIKGNRGIFSVAISPREDDKLTEKQMDQAIEMIEQEFKLQDQNKIRVDHEKDGRFHAHLFWSIIKYDENKEKFKQVDLELYKRRLQKCANEMTEEFGLEEVRRTPNEQTMQVNNHDRMVAQREGKTAPKYKQRKQQVTQIWEDTKGQDVQEFIEGLRAAGYDIARGRKATVVIIDQDGDQFNLVRDLPRLVKTSHVRERFGKEMLKELPTVEEALSYRQYDGVGERIDQQLKQHDAAHEAGRKTAERQKETEKRQQNRKAELAKREHQVLDRGNKAKVVKKVQERKPANDEHLVKLDKEREWDAIANQRRREQSIRMKPSYDILNRDKEEIKQIEETLKAREKSNALLKSFSKKRIQALRDKLEDLKRNVAEYEPRIHEEEQSFEARLEQEKPAELQRPVDQDQSNVVDFSTAAEEKNKKQLAREKFREELRREREQNRGQELDQSLGYD